MNFKIMLGGHDLEMETISELVETERPGAVVDLNLGWGARASAYRAEIEAALAAGATPVLVELEWDLDLPRDRVLEVDHHGKRAGRLAPTSLEQVFGLLELPPSRWTRWFDLVAANDRGHVRAMKDIGATRDEIREVRRRDLAAQGATGEQFEAARKAVAGRELRAGGVVTLVRLPHARASIVADEMNADLGGPGYEVLAVASPDQTNVWGPGEIIAALDGEFPGGWYGGDLPDSGFWGRAGDTAPVVEWLARRLETRSAGLAESE